MSNIKKYVYNIMDKNLDKFSKNEKEFIYSNEDLIIKIYRIFSIDYFNNTYIKK